MKIVVITQDVAKNWKYTLRSKILLKEAYSEPSLTFTMEFCSSIVNDF